MPTRDRGFVRHGFGAARPYLHGPYELPAFVSSVFDAIELERHAFGPRKAHVELRIADSVVVIEAGAVPVDGQPWMPALCVYVPNVDEVYRRALALGASAVAAPEDKPYGERSGGFRDSAGNTWWVTTLLR